MSAPGAQLAEPIKVGRYRRRIQLVYPDVKDADMSWAEALADLEEAIRDPIARYLRIEKFHRAGRKPAPWIKTDKPWDDPDVTGKLPALDSLTHDKAYFRAVEQARLHGGLLDYSGRSAAPPNRTRGSGHPAGARGARRQGPPLHSTETA